MDLFYLNYKYTATLEYPSNAQVAAFGQEDLRFGHNGSNIETQKVP